MEEPKLSFADLRKRFEQGNKTQPQPATIKPVVQPASTTGKSVNTVQPPVTASKQPVKEVTAPSTVNTKPAETAPANSIPSTIQKPKVEPETTTKPALPSEHPKPSSSLSQNPFIARNNAQQKSSATISETIKPSDNSTATRTQAPHEVKPVQEEAKSSPFGNIKQQTSTTTPASTTHTQSSEQENESPKPSVTSEVSKPVSTSTTSQNPAPAESESSSKPSNIFTASNTNATTEIKKTQEEVKPSPFGPTKNTATTSSPTKSNQPEENSSSPSKSFGASPFGASKQTVTPPPSTNTTATQAISSTKTTAEPEKILNKPSVVVNSKPGEFKPIPKEQGKVDEGTPVVNKVTSPDTADEPKMSIKDRMKMFEKAKSDDSGLKPLPKTTTTTSTTVKTAGLPNKAAQEITSPPTVTQTTAVSQPKPVVVKEEPIIVNKPVVKEPEVVSKPAVGSVKQNIFNKEETKKEEAPAPVAHKKSVDRKDSSDKPVPITHATTAPVHSITKKNADFASNLNALLGGKVSTAEPIKVVKPKDEGASSQDAYTEALLAKPTTVSTKKKATLVFMDDDEDF